MELMQKATSVAMLVFVLSSMLAMGLDLTVGQIIAPLRNARLVVLSLLVNFVLMPLGALGLAALLRLDQPLGVGLLLLGLAAGAPFLPKLAQIARGNLAFAVGLMVLLMVVTVGYLPLVLPSLLPGVSVNPAKIARSLFLLMLLPLVGALAVKAYFAGVAARTKPLFDRLSNLGLIVLVLLITAGNVNNVLADRLCDRVVARRTGLEYSAGPSPGHCATQHCRRARGGQPKFQRLESGRHGGRRSDCEFADSYAAVAGAGQA